MIRVDTTRLRADQHYFLRPILLWPWMAPRRCIDRSSLRETHDSAESHCGDGVTESMVPVRGFATLRNPVVAVGFDFSGVVPLAS